MKMKLKLKHKLCMVLLAVIAALCLCLGLAACDDKTPESQSPAGGSQTEQESGSGGGTSGGTESGTENTASLEGKVFVFYDIECEAFDENTLEQTRQVNKDTTYEFGSNGLVINKVYIDGYPSLNIGVYSLNGNALKITLGANIINGTYDGIDTIVIVSPASETVTFKIIFREKVQ